MKSSSLRTLDKFLGTFLYLAVWLVLPLVSGKKGSKNLLVIKLWAVGESVLLLPSIQQLHKKGYKITVLCTKQNIDIFSGQEFIKNLIVFDFSRLMGILSVLKDLRRGDFSVAVDAEPFTRFSAVLCALSGASLRVGFENRGLLYSKNVHIREQEHAVAIFHDLMSEVSPFDVPKNLVPVTAIPCGFGISKNSIAMHAGSASSSRTRRWSEENFCAVCKHFLEKGWTVYLVGSGEESEINKRIALLCKNKKHVIDMSNQLTLQQLAFLFSRVDLVVANDSGPMHVAASMNVPVIGLFGPNVPERFGPYGKKCAGLRSDESGPCILPFRSRFPECSHDHMKTLYPETVIKTAEKMLR